MNWVTGSKLFWDLFSRTLVQYFPVFLISSLYAFVKIWCKMSHSAITKSYIIIPRSWAGSSKGRLQENYMYYGAVFKHMKCYFKKKDKAVCAARCQIFKKGSEVSDISVSMNKYGLSMCHNCCLRMEDINSPLARPWKEIQIYSLNILSGKMWLLSFTAYSCYLRLKRRCGGLKPAEEVPSSINVAIIPSGCPESSIKVNA